MRQSRPTATAFAVLWAAAVVYACGGGGFAGVAGKKTDDASKSKKSADDGGDGKATTGKGSKVGTKDGNDDGGASGTNGTSGTSGTSGKDKDGTLEGGDETPDGAGKETAKDAKDNPIDGGGGTTSLLAPIKIEVIRSDCETVVHVKRIDASGNEGPEQKCSFGDDQLGSCDIEGMCHKTQDSTIATRWTLCGDKEINPTIRGSVKRAGGGGNKIEVAVDEEEDGDCGLFGPCVDLTKDNTIRYTCPNADKILTIKDLQ